MFGGPIFTGVKFAGQLDTFGWLSHFWDIFLIFVGVADINMYKRQSFIPF